ncbi:MAG: aldo/keto reductase [Pelagibacterales bacterium]|nr:aldo/keto reductase [Pelagibacterales bacterium]OUV27663.1 MAG: hypothetical protein CBC69_02710 [Alphaproteobacteria bacterium TMED109]RCL83034.1 MAG: aldo/keto reductase [Alphaproteobacteria bacterium]|tara:strand:+ start:88 stop:1071 length:984 start_codon:yes stop_codon:yes gene_type:complete
MEYVRFGSSGMKVSKICFGTMMFAMKKGWRNYALGKKEAAPVFRHALESGINFFDTADVYSNGSCEEVTGELLKEMSNRDEVVLATKVYNPMGKGPNQKGLSRKYIFNAIDASLSRLKMDYVDLYIIHRWDYETPIEETMEALHDVVKSGKARYIGASSMFAWQLVKAQETAEKNGWTKFISMQNHLNLIYREEEREMIPLCINDNLAITPWSPLARGFLAGNRSKNGGGKTDRAKNDVLADDYYYSKADFKVLDSIKKIANQENRQPVEVALAWLLQKKGITAPIVGPGKLEQLKTLLNSLSLKLSEKQILSLEKSYQPKKISGHI